MDKETEELKRATEHLCGMLSQVEERFEKLRSQINETEEESEQVTEDNMLKEQEVVISEKQAEVFEERVATILKKQAAWFEEQVAAMLVKQAAILKEQFEVLLGKQAEMLETRHADSEQRKTSAVFSRQCSHCIVKQCALCSVLDSKMM